VAVIARAIGLWWLNACRIVYVVDESESVRRFGFVYGTLPDHAGTGEERFLIEWDRDDDSVWYDILAFSRPNQFLTRLGYPLVRRTQKRFGRESAAVMLRAAEVGREARQTDQSKGELWQGGDERMLPLYHQLYFTFRFADDRIIPRFHLEGVEAGRQVKVFKIDPGTGDWLGLLTTATVGEGGWVDLREPLLVRAGEAFIAVPEQAD
jgi:hypothetical protein